ncbi:hypothetical protein C8R43DRAFT_951468 [Mycena crocata]|nr:hypothetical protein C8R43DRAFT_951468 [Mycena crocata]
MTAVPVYGTVSSPRFIRFCFVFLPVEIVAENVQKVVPAIQSRNACGIRVPVSETDLPQNFVPRPCHDKNRHVERDESAQNSGRSGTMHRVDARMQSAGSNASAGVSGVAGGWSQLLDTRDTKNGPVCSHSDKMALPKVWSLNDLIFEDRDWRRSNGVSKYQAPGFDQVGLCQWLRGSTLESEAMAFPSSVALRNDSLLKHGGDEEQWEEEIRSARQVWIIPHQWFPVISNAISNAISTRLAPICALLMVGNDSN